MSLELVSSGSLCSTGASEVLTWIEPVRVWDTIGEDKILKGEYRALSGRMYAALISVFA